jgi:hypothetical protein
MRMSGHTRHAPSGEYQGGEARATHGSATHVHHFQVHQPVGLHVETLKPVQRCSMPHGFDVTEATLGAGTHGRGHGIPAQNIHDIVEDHTNTTTKTHQTGQGTADRRGAWVSKIDQRKRQGENSDSWS